MLSGQCRNAQINSLALEAQLAPAVLRSPMIRDIHPRDNLQPGDRGILQMLGDFENLLEESIYTLPNEQIFFFRFDVDVAGPFLGGAAQDQINKSDHWSEFRIFRQLGCIGVLVGFFLRYNFAFGFRACKPFIEPFRRRKPPISIGGRGVLLGGGN